MIKERRRCEEQREFDQLRAQFGMDNDGNFHTQSICNMQNAVYRGEMSVVDYYERQVQSLKKGYTSLLNRPYETINLEERFSGIQHAALALTCWDQFNED